MLSAFRQSSKLLRFGNVFRRKTFLCTEAAPQGPNIAAITKGNKDLEHKLKVLVLEIDVLRQEGKMVPDDTYISDTHWEELLNLPSYSARRSFLEFLFKVQKKKENRQKKKEEKRLEKFPGEKPVKDENEPLEEFVSKYDLAHNNILLRIYDTTINQMYNNRLVQAMKFGQKLVVDCGYHEDMVGRENKNCAKQLCLLFSDNRSHDDPFDLHFCNVNRESTLMKSLHKFIATMYEPWFPLHLHESSYLEQFPKEKLVYLTPHCREEMIEYDHDAIYIIGGIVDKINNQPLSLAKAKREGLRMAKFPLDRYLQWGAGSGKSLTLNQVVSILLDVKTTGDWKYALRHVPQRKILNIEPSRPQYRRTWSPAGRVDFNNLSYKEKAVPKERMVKIKKIMF